MSTHAPERARGASKSRAASNDPYLPFAHQVADMLGEETLSAFSQIYQTVKVLGRDRVTGLLRQTLEIETNGGEMILRGTRKRTVGGIWFRLAKEQYGDLLPFLFHRQRPATSNTQSNQPSDPGEQCPQIQ